MPLGDQGASPATRRRQLSADADARRGAEHGVECCCWNCTGQLSCGVGVAALAVQAKLSSCLGHRRDADAEFQRGLSVLLFLFSFCIFLFPLFDVDIDLFHFFAVSIDVSTNPIASLLNYCFFSNIIKPGLFILLFTLVISLI